MDRIAAAARVTKRTIYTYFGNKDGVFTEMQRRLAANVSGESSHASRITFGPSTAKRRPPMPNRSTPCCWAKTTGGGGSGCSDR